MQAETDKKAMAYRIWTPGNYNTGQQNAFSSKSTKVYEEKTPSSNGCLVDVPESNQPSDSVPSIVGVNQTSFDMNNKETNMELDCRFPGEEMTNNTLDGPGKQKKQLLDHRNPASSSELQIVGVTTETSLVPSESAAASPQQLKSISNQQYPFTPLTADFQRREQRIMERLKVYFIIYTTSMLVPELGQIIFYFIVLLLSSVTWWGPRLLFLL